jgi:hypothetical protein
MIGKKYIKYAVKKSDRYHYFCNKKPDQTVASLYGYNQEDFVKLSIEIIEEISINDMEKYQGVLTGFYDIIRDELSGAFIFNSLVQTSVCFETYPTKEYGSFVKLKLNVLDSTAE